MTITEHRERLKSKGYTEFEKMEAMTHVWSDSACKGYCIEVLERRGYDHDQIMNFLEDLSRAFRSISVPEAEKKYQNPYFLAETCPEYRRNVLGWKD